MTREAAPRTWGTWPTGDAGPRRRLSGRALRLHATLAFVVCGCLAAGGFELSRALAGNELSWVYVFEWPFFAAFSVRIWWRLLHEDEVPAPTTAPAVPRVPAARTAGAGTAGAGTDPQLEAWLAYQARLHARYPPGGPPARVPH